MDQQLERIEKKLSEIDSKVETVFRSAEKIRRYFLWTLIITIVVVAIPLLILPFVIPYFLQTVILPAGF